MKLYHGTSRGDADKILKGGFNTRARGGWNALGSGIYFTPNAKEAGKYGEVILEVELEEAFMEDEILDLGDNGHDLDSMKEKAIEYSEFDELEEAIVDYVFEVKDKCGIKFEFNVGVHICIFNTDGVVEPENIKEIIN